jgi:uroporphyrinogen III methyltransferase/synthase
VAAGKPPSTPVAIIRRCTLPDQTRIDCTLGEVADQIREQRVRPPAVVIVGEVAGLAAARSWFDTRPLFGKRIMVTRAVGQASQLAERLEELGADVVLQPAIEIGPPADWRPVDEALDRLAEFDWLVFSSSNGVRYLLDRLGTNGRDLRSLGGIRLAAIGPGTSQELSRYYLRADLQPEDYRAESLAAALCRDARGKRFLLARASRGREVLATELQRAGGCVEQVVVYTSSDYPTADQHTSEWLAAGRIDYVTVTSSAIARSLNTLFGRQLTRSKLASISPVTSETLRELGYPPALEAAVYTMPGVVEAILGDVNAGRSADKPGQAAG